ncbi:MAG: hypothetical protein KGI80_00315 [Verrucomicrobiota bacterium]|nr:hypothetical protein [Verrucomicrobiota bacterium]
MKKIAFLTGLIAMLGNNGLFAQEMMNKAPQNGSCPSYNTEAAWGVGLGCLAVLATVVGITVSSAASTPSTYSP